MKGIASASTKSQVDSSATKNILPAKKSRFARIRASLDKLFSSIKPSKTDPKPVSIESIVNPVQPPEHNVDRFTIDDSSSFEKTGLVVLNNATKIHQKMSADRADKTTLNVIYKKYDSDFKPRSSENTTAGSIDFKFDEETSVKAYNVRPGTTAQSTAHSDVDYLAASSFGPYLPAITIDENGHSSLSYYFGNFANAGEKPSENNMEAFEPKENSTAYVIDRPGNKRTQRTVNIINNLAKYANVQVITLPEEESISILLNTKTNTLLAYPLDASSTI